MPFTVEISGFIPAQFTGSDYTSPVLTQSFLASLSEFYELKTGSNTLTASDVKNIQNQLNYLMEIAKNGVSINLDPLNPGNPLPSGSPPGVYPNQTYYLTTPMVDVLDRLFKSLAPNGNLSSITLADLNNFRNGTATQNTLDIQNIFVYAARLFAVLPPSVPGGPTSAISTDPATAAMQITRIFDTSRVFEASTVSESVGRSMQAFVEMEYVNAANEVINEKLAALKEALEATKNTLENLNRLQQIHNEITVVSRKFTYQLGSTTAPDPTIDEYITNYEKYASSQLKQALIPQLTSEFLPFSLPSSEVTISVLPQPFPGASGPAWRFILTLNDPSKYYAFNTSTNQFTPVATTYSFNFYFASSISFNPYNLTQAQIAQIVGDGTGGIQKFPLIGKLSSMSVLKDELIGRKGMMSGLLAELSAITPASVLDDDLKRSQALLGQVSAVYKDLKDNLGNFTTATTTASAMQAVRTWIMDNYQTFSSASATNAGKYQQNLTNAITAAQSTNDTQKQDVRNSLLVFEEFYKSAAAVLTQLNQLISKIAQGIAK